MHEYTIHTVESAPEGSREAMRAMRQKFGFVPNLIGELAAAPTALRAYVALGQLIEESTFTPVEQQLILLSVSVVNDCHYCVAAHSGGLKRAGFADDQIEAARDGLSLDDTKLEALRRFTRAVVRNRGHMTDSELQAFLRAGYHKGQVLEVLVGVAMKTISNYTNHIAETPLDTQLQAFAWESESTAV